MSPEDRKYTKTHEWIKIEGKSAVMGITDHAQHALGDITFVELPAIGKVLKQGQECGVIESVKAASDIYSPISGKVVEVNNLLKDNPEIINQDAFGKGWIAKLSDVDAGQLDSLLGGKDYDATAGNE